MYVYWNIACRCRVSYPKIASAFLPIPSAMYRTKTLHFVLRRVELLKSRVEPLNQSLSTAKLDISRIYIYVAQKALSGNSINQLYIEDAIKKRNMIFESFTLSNATIST